MKVKKHGKRYDDGSPFTGKCYCGCEVEVTRNEIKTLDGDRPGEETSYYVKCPECGQHIYIRDRRLGNEPQRYDYNQYER